MLGEPGRREQGGVACRGAPLFVCTPPHRFRFDALATVRIDLNADVGEDAAASAVGRDARLMSFITSASIAAGFHAGNPSLVRHTIRLAREHGVGVGAHPGYLDPAGFGRREVAGDPVDVENLVVYQVAAVAGLAAAEGVRLRHVKVHGALYNQAARDAGLARAVARAVAVVDHTLILFAPPSSCLARAGRDAGLRVAAELFADRAYEPDGTLVSRRTPGAVLHEARDVVPRAIRMVAEHMVTAMDGAVIRFDAADTLAIHSDTEGAEHLAAALRAGLREARIDVRPIGDE